MGGAVQIGAVQIGAVQIGAVQTLEARLEATYHPYMLLDSLFAQFRRMFKARVPATNKNASENDDEHIDLNNPFPNTVVIEFTDVIDLHSIPPSQIRAVVEDFIEEAHRRRLRWVRIIHGKGIGVQREIIRSILSRTPYVLNFRDAPPEAGGWGATAVTLRVDDPEMTL